jgi:hypothetical membrane protein
MAVSPNLERASALAGIVGASAIAVGSAVTALAYTGTAGQPYSPLNHWISELGQTGVSELAAVFNIALVVGGICFVVFMTGLRLVRTGRFAWVYGTIGAVAGVAGAYVGIFPMNRLEQHTLAALAFFNLGWIAVALASLDFVRRPDPRFPRWLAYIGGLTVVAFVSFLAVAIPLAGGAGLGAPDPRPEIWFVAILEWAALVGILLWVLATGWTWWRALGNRIG